MRVDILIDGHHVGEGEAWTVYSNSSVLRSDRGIEFIDGLSAFVLTGARFRDGHVERLEELMRTGRDVDCVVKVSESHNQGTGRVLHVATKGAEMRALTFASREFVLHATIGEEP